MPQTAQQPSRSSNIWTSACGNIYYRRTAAAAERQTPVENAGFPTPLIGPRRTRPHAIHIVTFPQGYVPRDLRGKDAAQSKSSQRKNRKKQAKQAKQAEKRHRSLRRKPSTNQLRQQTQERQGQSPRPAQDRQQHRLSTATIASWVRDDSATSSTTSSFRPVLGKLFASFAAHSLGAKHNSAATTTDTSAAGTANTTDIGSATAVAAATAAGTGTAVSGSGAATAAGAPQRAGLAPATGIPTPLAHDVIPHHRQNSAPEIGANPPWAAQPLQACRPSSRPHDQARPHSISPETCLCSPRHISHHGPSFAPTPPSPRNQDLQDQDPEQDPRRFSSLTTATVDSALSAATIDGIVPCPAHSRPAEAACLDTRNSTSVSPRSSTASGISSAMATRLAPPFSAYGLPANGNNRGSVMSIRPPAAISKSSASSVVSEVPKPVATGSGVSCSILLAEPTVFLSGFDHDSRSRRQGQTGTALLRGKLRLSVSKNVKIKAVQLKLVGRARTEWPEGIPPLKQEIFEEESLRTQVLTFFNAMYDGWESDYGNQCTYRLKDSSTNSSSSNLSVRQSLAPTAAVALGAASNMSAKDLKRLSLQSVQSRSFGKGDAAGSNTSATQAKGFKVFYPGIYDYSFELPIDHHQLETAKLQYGSVKWELQATVDRAGAFKPNLNGTKEVPIARVPDQLSLEMSEPISITRQWEDQLHYDIVISGKSFPIGSKIPIAFKLTPLAKVQIHKLRVYVTESVEYWTNDRRVTRRDPGRKIMLLEKSAGKPLDQAWSTSELRTVRGGELSGSARREARELAAQRRAIEASRRRASPDPLPEPSENLLGDLDLGLESYWGSTEIEANVQLPTCEMMAKNKDLTLHPDCSWKNVNVFHWIKIVLRLSRLDPEDPTGTKRRHFEISIDSPFTVLNCRAIQANTNLPAYSNPVSQPVPYQSTCGCPDATSVATLNSPNSSTGTLPGLDVNDNLPAPPAAAHLNHAGGQQGPAPTDSLGIYDAPRPMHLMRVPSFNPPAFDDDTAPPPLAQLVIPDSRPADEVAMTPPPQYDVVVGTPSVDGLADYFTRLADYGYDEEDSGSDVEDGPARILARSGRVNVVHPRTPGGRMPSRSMEMARRPTELELRAAQQPMSPDGANSWTRPPLRPETSTARQ
ncbi:hypothetical protein S40288_04248 [Stachybotrys chartarum IBT 40288]|nr:hypothetical protein S40288_04248 [Stachybotrys chartarum IBT 40288]